MTTAPEGGRGLEWTGERYVPEVAGNIRLEHVHRYLLARELVRDRRVLDIACGEGYGSDLLASVAAHVVGVDIATEALDHARRRYRRPHLRFVAGSCIAIPMAAESVDVVVSFETIEHVDQHDTMLREVRRVLRPDGLLIISSPDRREYSDIPSYQNPFHVRELYRDEFEALLSSQFRSVSLVGQRVKAGSMVGPLGSGNAAFLSFGAAEPTDRVEGLRAPLYLIGVATDGQLPRIPTGLLDGGEFVWSEDHTQAIRGLLDQHRSEVEQLAHARTAHEAAAGALRAELDRHAASVTALAADKARAEERSGWLQEEIERRGRRINELDAERERLQQLSGEVHQALEQARAQLGDALGELQVARESIRTHEIALTALGAEREAERESWKALEAERQSIRAMLKVMENSHSWRLTAPLRGMRRQMKRAASLLGSGGAAEDRHPTRQKPPAPLTDEARPTGSSPEPATAAAPPEACADSPMNREPSRTPNVGPSTSDAVQLSPNPRQRPSIVLVAHDAHLYGAQLLALHLARTLSTALGYDVQLLLHGDGPLKPEFEATSHVFDFFSVTSTPEVRRRIIHELRENGARVALCNTAVVGETVALLKAGGFAVVSMIHELPGIIRQYGLEGSIASIARHADHVVFAAQVVRDRFIELTDLEPRKAVLRPQGLYGLSRFKGRTKEARQELRSRLGLSQETRILLGVGSADLRKGIDLFADVGFMLTGRRGDVACVWLGPPNAEDVAPIQARIVEAGRQSTIILHGPSRDPDLFFAGSDAYLMTSREDPFPAVVVEALDAELPVIGFEDGGGFVELLRRDCGVLVPYLDTTAMADATERVLDDPALRRRLAGIGRQIVDAEFGFVDYARFLTQIAGRRPRVSVIVPNFNYAHYLPTRLRSILAQTYSPHEIIFLDDHSSDHSVAVAERILADSPIPFRIITNATNQGCYHQWLRGIREATGDLIWIAEADDDCNPMMVDALVPAFARDSVVLAYCQSKQIDEQGREHAPDYLAWTSDVEPTKWRHPYVRAGAEEIRDSLVVKNTIPNVSAVLMRKPNLSGIESRLRELRNAGDWLVYVHVLERGDIAFVPEALNYHRRHVGSVTIGHGGLNLLRENLRVQRYILERHQITPEVERKRDMCLQVTYEYLGLNVDGPASYKDCEALKAELLTIGG